MKIHLKQLLDLDASGTRKNETKYENRNLAFTNYTNTQNTILLITH